MYQHPQMQHQQQQQQQVGMVTGGGPSPVGSHNTPSPQALSESDVDEHTIRNNNILKRPSPNGDSFQQQQQHLMQQQVSKNKTFVFTQHELAFSSSSFFNFPFQW